MPNVLTAIANIVHRRAFFLPNAGPNYTRVNTVGGAFDNNLHYALRDRVWSSDNCF